MTAVTTSSPSTTGPVTPGSWLPAPMPTPGEPARRRRRVSRPLLVRLAMVLVVLAVVAFAVAVHQAVTDAQRTVTAIGQDDTDGIRTAQRIKSDLAEMDLVVTQELLAPSAPEGELPEAYIRAHKDLVADLDDASRQNTLGTAETVPLANLEYERAQYHALVRDAIFADQRGDRSDALALEQQAHDVMTGELGLHEQADAFDKANTYALNQSYADHKGTSTTSSDLLKTAGIGLIALLVVLLLWHVVAFHRWLNVGLALAALAAVVMTASAAMHIDDSDQHLRRARENAFDPVHELWQARAAAYSARQAEAQALLDPSRADDAEARFQAAAGRLYRLPVGADDGVGYEAGDVAAEAAQFHVQIGIGGYLANELRNPAVATRPKAATREALTAFAAYLEAHELVRDAAAGSETDAAVASFLSQEDGDNGATFAALVASLDHTLDLNEQAFTDNAGEAAVSLEHIELVTLVGSAVLLVLAMWGLSQRLREYSGA